MISGFFTINDYTNNTPNGVNPVGELSERSSTYARDVRSYANSVGALKVFDGGGLDTSDPTVFDIICETVSDLLVTIPGYTTAMGSLLVSITNALGSAAVGVTVGAAILNPIDSRVYPEYVSFSVNYNQQAYPVKIWLADTSFSAQYPYGHFDLITPITNLQNLYNGFIGCKAIIDGLTPSTLVNLIHNQVNYTYTGVDTLTVRVFNRLDQTDYFDLPVAVVYNGGGIFCNSGAYLNRLISDLVNGGSITLDEWVSIIPSLIPVNRYYVLPNWKNTSVVNLAVAAPLGSPTVYLESSDSWAAKYFPDYDPSVIAAKLNYTVGVYKSLGLYILPDHDNLDGVIPWRINFFDYFVVAVGDVNVEQMTPGTQLVVVAMDRLIRFAEAYLPGATLPADFSIEMRGNYTYIYAIAGTTKLCVLTRESDLRNG
jgi:hypothetical protein